MIGALFVTNVSYSALAATYIYDLDGDMLAMLLAVCAAYLLLRGTLRRRALAVIPIVGDFKYAKQNYDPGAILDSDKDIDAGMFKFVLTAWGDHQIKLKSAFRLATTSVALIGGVAKSESDKHLAGEKLKASPVFNTDDGSKPTSGVTYLWQHLSNNVWTDCTNSYTGYNTDELTTTDNQDEGVTFRCKITYNSVSAFTNAIKMA